MLHWTNKITTFQVKLSHRLKRKLIKQIKIMDYKGYGKCLNTLHQYWRHPNRRKYYKDEIYNELKKSYPDRDNLYITTGGAASFRKLYGPFGDNGVKLVTKNEMDINDLLKYICSKYIRTDTDRVPF